MDLFNQQIDFDKNWLPYDGIVNCYQRIYNDHNTQLYFERLLREIEWKNDEAIIFGKHITTKRKVAWYADQPYQYTYSKISKTALLWTPLLLELKEKVERYTQQKYNSCLLNLYHNGQEGVAWHSDDEKDLLAYGSIASLSFGATRKFVFKHKSSKEKVEFLLHAGELLEMKGATQLHWVHSIPTTKKVKAPRISLTFRQMVK